jgi:SAM-dependent methyltransferase
MKNAWRLEKSTYAGLAMHCAPGTHEAALSLVLRHSVPRTSVLDLGSGSGAMLARFRDAGFTQLHAVERSVKRFQFPGIDPLAIDLNTQFCQQVDRHFALVSAIEVIEHLDSPRHFLRQVRELLEEGGYLLVTSPNVSHWVGRIHFLLRGELRWFAEKHYPMHVSPITDVQMRFMLKENGLELVDATSAGSFFGPLKQLALAPASLFFGAVFGRRTWGDINIYLAKKSTNEKPVCL